MGSYFSSNPQHVLNNQHKNLTSPQNLPNYSKKYLQEAIYEQEKFKANANLLKQKYTEMLSSDSVHACTTYWYKNINGQCDRLKLFVDELNKIQYLTSPIIFYYENSDSTCGMRVDLHTNALHPQPLQKEDYLKHIML